MRKVSGSSPLLPTLIIIMPTAVQEQLKVLIELQKVDTEIYQLKKELKAFPLLQTKLEADFEKKKAASKAAEDELRTLQMKQREKDNELLSKEDKIKKLQSQLYQLKSNKEYSVMEMEIKGGKADKSLLEEEILKMMDEVDQARQRFSREKEALTSEERKLKEGISAIQKKAAEITSQIAEYEEKRKAHLPGVERRLLAQYDKTIKNREGVGLVPVKNNSCGGCHIGLPPQIVNEIQIGEKLIVCESCARIIYWPS